MEDNKRVLNDDLLLNTKAMIKKGIKLDNGDPIQNHNNQINDDLLDKDFLGDPLRD